MHLTTQWFLQSVSNCPRNKPFLEVGWFKIIKCMVMNQYSTCNMHFVHRKRWVDVWDFFRNSLHFKRTILLQFSRASSPLVHKQSSIFIIIAFKVFQAISEFLRGNMEPCRWTFDQIMLHSISKQRKKCFIHVWIIFPPSEITAISILHLVVWTIWQHTLKSQCTEIWCLILWVIK